MEKDREPFNGRWRAIGRWIMVGTFVITFLSSIVLVVWAVAQNNERFEAMSKNVTQLNEGTKSQVQINEQLKNQLIALRENQIELKYKADRVDAILRLPPIGYDKRK